MDLLNEVYYKSVAENERNLQFWQNYLHSLKSLDFSLYSDKLRVPVLVPIGSRILFRGELKHTNEVTIALGADYFVKCSLKQAEVLREHRIKDAESKLAIFLREKEYLEKQMSFTKQNLYENQGQELVEYYSEEEDKAWRQKHRENVKQYKQSKKKDEDSDDNSKKDITDEELWDRLEELELQEELENELMSMSTNDHNITDVRESFIVKEQDTIKRNTQPHTEQTIAENVHTEKGDKEKENKSKKVCFKEDQPEHTSKFAILQQVIDRQNELQEKLTELKNRNRSQSKTEKDLVAMLDEQEQLDELEDEMDRLSDIIDNEDVEEEEMVDPQTTKLERRVSFVDENDSETLELTFKHSSVEPSNEPYNPDKGITKPSDIYKAFPNSFGNSTTSILKKSKYEAISLNPENYTIHNEPIPPIQEQENIEPESIVIKDIIERNNPDDKKVESQARPTSLFRKKRMQNK